MEPRFETIEEKKLAGKRLTMSLARNRTTEVWGSFMPCRKGIHNAVGPALYSLQDYPPSYFHHFDPAQEFVKWAAVEVSDFDTLPAGIEAFVLPCGLYAVFLHKGPSTDTRIFQYIYTDWLPRSG